MREPLTLPAPAGCPTASAARTRRPAQANARTVNYLTMMRIRSETMAPSPRKPSAAWRSTFSNMWPAPMNMWPAPTNMWPAPANTAPLCRAEPPRATAHPVPSPHPLPHTRARGTTDGRHRQPPEVPAGAAAPAHPPRRTALHPSAARTEAGRRCRSAGGPPWPRPPPTLTAIDRAADCGPPARAHRARRRNDETSACSGTGGRRARSRAERALSRGAGRRSTARGARCPRRSTAARSGASGCRRHRQRPGCR